MSADKTAAHETGDRRDGWWEIHDTTDPLIRYLRDRRLVVALHILRRHAALDARQQSVLVVCGGVGGEGTFLANQGFSDVTVSDVSEEDLQICRQRDGRLKTLVLNAESMSEVPDSAYDIVLVQDGLHHLSRPTLGLTEMIRVARTAAVIIEPHYGLVGKLIGTEWERHAADVNYVFRWNNAILEQVTQSYLLDIGATVVPLRMWDHNFAVGKLVDRFLPPRLRLPGAKALYAALRALSPLGNMMVGVIIKPESSRVKST